MPQEAQDHEDQPVRPAIRVCLVPLVKMVHEVLLVEMERTVTKGLLEGMEVPVHPALLAHKDHPVTRALAVGPAIRVIKG